MLTPPLDASATNYLLLQKFGNVFCHNNNNQCFVLLNFVDVAKVESSQKTKEKKIEIWLYYNGGPNSFFFLVMNFCTAIFTHEKEYFYLKCMDLLPKSCLQKN